MQVIPMILAAGSLSVVAGTPLPPESSLVHMNARDVSTRSHSHSLRHAHLHHSIQKREYTVFGGNGDVSEGWPSIGNWLSFDSLFSASKSVIKESCASFGSEPNDSDQEIDDIRDAINDVASSSGVDARFIFAVMMQESNGCVRVKTTNYGVNNPGLMQSHNGKASCSSTGNVQSPCPKSTIKQMIQEGVEGTSSGDGLKQCLSQAPGEGAAKYYAAARIYNSGHLDPSGNLGKGVATHCYCSDIANRLLGWSFGPSACNQGIIGTLNSSPGGGVSGGGSSGGDSSPSPEPSSEPSSEPSPSLEPTTSAEPSPVLPTLSLPTLSLPDATPTTTVSSSAEEPTPTSTPVETPTDVPTLSSSSTAAAVPSGSSDGTPKSPTIISTCQQFYTVQQDDSCSSLGKKFGINIAQVVGWNQGVNAECSNLQPGTQYCVKAPA